MLCEIYLTVIYRNGEININYFDDYDTFFIDEIEKTDNQILKDIEEQEFDILSEIKALQADGIIQEYFILRKGLI